MFHPLRTLIALTVLWVCAVTALPAGATTQAPADSTATPRFMVVDGDTLWVAVPLEIFGTRVPAGLPGQLRPVGVISGDDITQRAATSISDLLATQPGLEAGQRRQFGLQSDLRLRGSSFEEVQVLLDGNDMGDAQTGHHLLDLPVALQDIARLEVLPGHGSVLYGTGAFGGTLNVVTKEPGDHTAGEVAVTGGGQGTRGGRAVGDFRLWPDTGARFSASALGTDGFAIPGPDGKSYWPGNDAEIYTATGHVVHTTGDGSWDAFGGYARREFGALDFYAPYPSRERTSTLVTSLKRNWAVSDRVTLEPRLDMRRHTDEFILLKDNPDFFTNDHETRHVAGQLRGILDLGRGHAMAWNLGGDYEDIDSRGLRSGVWGEALGTHVRRGASLAMEIDRNLGRLRWQLGGRADARDAFAPRLTGTAAVACDLTQAVTLRGSTGNMYRIPTFTELYYVSPANMGNPDLKPERGWDWDAGVRWGRGAVAVQTTYFERYEHDLIEWARPAAGDDPWQVLNIAQGKARGTETSLDWTLPPGHSLGVAWSWLEKTSDLVPGYVGKYSLLVPRQVLAAQGRLVLPAGFTLAMTARYLERTGGAGAFNTVFVLDGKLTWEHGPWFANLSGTNLLDRTYQEVPGIAMSGPLAVLETGYGF